MAKKTNPWKKEWDDLLKREKKYIDRRKDGPTSLLFEKLDGIIPKKLRDTLSNAFNKGFAMVFDKGTKVIEKTYNKGGMEAEYKINEYAYELKGNINSARRFTKQAKGKKAVNLLISLAEGLGFGILGLALLDIPVFLGMVLKSVYEVAGSFGYGYESDEEKVFILKVIEVAMCDGEQFVQGNSEVDEAIDYIVSVGDYISGWEITKEEQMKNTSDSLVSEMLYTKFIQKIPLIGVIGGLFDPAYLNRITNYAVLKYRRRFLAAKLTERESKL